MISQLSTRTSSESISVRPSLRKMQVLHNRQPNPNSSICQCMADAPLPVDHEPVLHFYQQNQIEMREHHQAEWVLQQERNLAQAILHAVGALVIVSDPSGRIVQFNQTCQQITGYTLDEVVGQRIWDVLTAPEDADQAQQFWANAPRGYTQGAVEQAWVTSAGEQRLISLTLSTLEDADGHIEYLIGTGVDVTETRQAEAALRKSEATNRALLDVIPDLMIRIREDGTYLDFLPARNFKVIQPFQEMRGQSIYDVVPRPAAEERMAYIRRALETQTTQVYEYQLEIEGEIFYEEARIAVSGEDEALAIIRDISERKHAEIQRQQVEAVLHSLVKGTASVTGENFFEALVQHIAQTLNIRHALVTSCHGQQVRTIAFYSDGQLQPNISYELNQTPCETGLDQPFYGYSRNCLQDINGLTQYLSDERLTCLEAESYFGLVLMNTQGSPIGTLCILDSQPIDHHSQVASILKIFAARAAAELERQQTMEALYLLNQELEARVESRTQDLSRINTALMNSNIALLESQEQLRRSEELLRLTIDNAPIGIVTCSLEGQFQTVNQAFCSMLGYTPDEILRQTVSTVTHPDDREASCHAMQELATGQGNTVELERRYLHKDGSTVEAIVRIGTMRDESGRPLRFVAEIEDIRDRKRAESDIRKALEAERELNDLKSRFVSMTSHEFRTPLGVIASSAGIIQDYGDRLDEAKTHKHLQRIQDSVTHMTQLLEDVLMLSRLEAGKLRLKLMPTSIDIFCQDIIEEVNLSDGSSRIACQIQSMPTEPVMLDQRLLRQILNNLLSNALKYSLPETTVYLQVVYQTNCFMLTIRDQGIGIPSEDLKHLFQSFHRAKNVGNIPGTGLGLSIVKKLVELHQGNITCTSQVNVGTTFTVSLPHF